MERGIIYYLVDSVVFLSAGYVIHIGLGRHLGAARYGVFGTIISLWAMSYTFLNYGVRKTISKYTAEDDTLSFAILRAGLKIQVFLGAIMTAGMLILADVIAALLNDHTLSPLIRLSALGVLPLALCEVYLGLMNGRREFGKGAITSVLYSVTKVLAIFVFVSLGLGVKGAIGGYIAAAVVGLLVARWLCDFREAGETFEVKRIVWFSVPLVMFSMSIAFLTNIDLLFVKSILKDNTLTGFYTAASNLARPLWYLSMAFAAVLLPSVSMSSANNNVELTRKYVNKAVRYTLMVLLPITFLVSRTAESLVTLLYSSSFVTAAKPLSVLVFGFMFFSMFSVFSTTLTAVGRPGLALAFTLSIVPIDIGLNLILVPVYGIMGAAFATSISFLSALIAAGWYVIRTYKTPTDFYSVLRIGGASVAVYVASIVWPASGMTLVGQYVFLLGVYFVLLILMKEIKKEELIEIKGLVPALRNVGISKTSRG